MVDPTPMPHTPVQGQPVGMPKMSELQRAHFELLQAQMQTLNAQAQAAALTQSNCELLAGELQRKMDALMAEVRSDLAAAAAATDGADREAA